MHSSLIFSRYKRTHRGRGSVCLWGGGEGGEGIRGLRVGALKGTEQEKFKTQVKIKDTAAVHRCAVDSKTKKLLRKNRIVGFSSHQPLLRNTPRDTNPAYGVGE